MVLRRSARVGWILLLVSFSLTLRAEAGLQNEDQTSVVKPPSSPFRVTVVEENPTMAVFGRDRHYTNGFKLALTSSQLVDDSIWNAPVRLLRSIYVFNRPSNVTDNRLEWTPAAQDIFTPQDHTHKFVTPNDRPFAGWLYAGFDIYLGIQGRLVAQNVFLDGDTFQNSRSVDKEIAVGDALAGAEVFYKDWFRAGFTFLLRSNEFTKQRGPDTFGGFNVSFAF
jgi:hypothetical protein